MLLKLLRIALSTEPMAEDGKRSELFPENIDWSEVIRLSYEQKVPALAVDGLKASGYDPREGKSGRQLEDLNAVLKPWFDDVKKNEESYAYYLTVLSTLCQIFHLNALKTIVLKGYGLSLDYPIPSHRGAGDIDIFVVNENNQPAFEHALAIIEQQLGIKTKKDGHDYCFSFKGILVELHYDITNIFFNTNNEKYITQRLMELLPLDLIPYGKIPGLFFPGANFNALYLTRHSFGHFFSASTTMRQFVDWLVFLHTHYSDVDWPVLKGELQKSNMKSFFDGYNIMLNRHLLLDIKLCPIVEMDNRTEEYIIDDIRHPNRYGRHPSQRIRRHLYQRFRYFFENRSKFKFISGRSWVRLLTESVISSLKDIVNRNI